MRLLLLLLFTLSTPASSAGETTTAHRSITNLLENTYGMQVSQLGQFGIWRRRRRRGSEISSASPQQVLIQSSLDLICTGAKTIQTLNACQCVCSSGFIYIRTARFKLCRQVRCSADHGGRCFWTRQRSNAQTACCTRRVATKMACFLEHYPRHHHVHLLGIRWTVRHWLSVVDALTNRSTSGARYEQLVVAVSGVLLELQTSSGRLLCCLVVVNG